MSWHELAAKAKRLLHPTRRPHRMVRISRRGTEYGIECPMCETMWDCEDHGGRFESDEKCPKCLEEERGDAQYDRMKDERAERDL